MRRTVSKTIEWSKDLKCPKQKEHLFLKRLPAHLFSKALSALQPPITRPSAAGTARVFTRIGRGAKCESGDVVRGAGGVRGGVACV